ncbi:MAG TPA: hypothetical protein VGG92_02345 [Caulobacteraceae bacterium]|jgi:uncharacterized membrane protein
MTNAAAAFSTRSSERFDIGGVIADTFSIVGKNLPIFALLAVLGAVVPGSIFGAVNFKFTSELQAPGAVANFPAHALQASGTVLLGALLFLVGFLYLQAAVSAVVISQKEGTAAPNVAFAPWRHVLPLFGILLLLGISVVLGLILLVVPGIIVALALSVATPARVGERLGVFASLQRSWDLTRGFRWRIFLTILLLDVILGVGELVAALLKVVFHTSTATWSVAVTPFISGAVDILNFTAVAVIYCELRRIKENGSASNVAAAFS